METVAQVTSFLLLLVALYFTYMTINVLYTIIKTRRNDHSMKSCLSQSGKIFFIVLLLIWIAVWVGGVIAIFYGINHNEFLFYINGFAAIAFTSLLVSYQVANITYVGNKQMIVGRLLIDYRKMKKVDISYSKEMTFVYAQKAFRFSTRWLDSAMLRKAISRRK